MSLAISFTSESACAPAKNHVGVGGILHGRGGVFAAEAFRRRKTADLGFERERAGLASPPEEEPEEEEDAGRFRKDDVRGAVPEYRTSARGRRETMAAVIRDTPIDGVLGTTPYRFVVFTETPHEGIEPTGTVREAVPPPRTKIIAMVGLVTAHGGDNAATGGSRRGGQVIAFPLTRDQYDNAQRVGELGYGVRLATHTFTDEELAGALDRLLGDTGLRERLAVARERIRRRDGLRGPVGLIERVGS
ncbi:hypothetical protein [Streptosporangium sp. NPDC051022]|uniref:glycosyltransferase n=1 Tax=Streptosporangium sp. NPDC051022 TaxID=3155752 RepID=UPI003431EE18